MSCFEWWPSSTGPTLIWRLEDIDARRPNIPDAENGALQIIEFKKAAGDIKGKPTDASSSTNERTSRLSAALSRYSPQSRLTDVDANALRDELKRVAPLVSKARGMVAFPRGRFFFPHSRDESSIELPNVQVLREVVSLLELDAALQLHDRNRKEAVTDCIAMMNIARYLDDESSAIAQLVAISISRQVVRAIERLEAQGEGHQRGTAGVPSQHRGYNKSANPPDAGARRAGTASAFLQCRRGGRHFRRRKSSSDSASTILRNCRASRICADSMPGFCNSLRSSWSSLNSRPNASLRYLQC